MKNKDWKNAHSGGGGAVYGFGLIGSLIYFLGHAQTFSEVVIGILKAIVWPAFLTFKLFEFLKL